MLEVRKFGMKITVGLGSPDLNPVEFLDADMNPPYRIWIKVDGLWAPTTYRGCSHDLMSMVRRMKTEADLCEFIEKIISDE